MVNPEKQRSSVDDHEAEVMDSGDRTNDDGFGDSSTVEGDGDLLIGQGDGVDRVIQFLQALDLQVMGACRADERLKPLLKLNNSAGAAEDRLLAHLSQVHIYNNRDNMLLVIG